MANILLADVKGGIDRLSRALSGVHVCFRATRYETAMHLLQRHEIDLIVCGFSFDDSQMIDLLVEVMRDQKYKHIPFVCWQNERSNLSESLITGAFNASRMLGACLCLDLESVTRMSDDALRETLEECLLFHGGLQRSVG